MPDCDLGRAVKGEEQERPRSLQLVGHVGRWIVGGTREEEDTDAEEMKV